MTLSSGTISGAVVVSIAAVTVLFGLALRGRSWTLWLAGYAATLLTLVFAWRSR